MNTRIYSVYDKAAERYLDPFTAPNDAVAIRGFSDAVNREGHPFNLHPEDYNLVLCGEFYAERGAIDAREWPASLVAGYQVVVKPEPYLDLDDVKDVDIKALRDSVAVRLERGDEDAD